MRCSEIEDKLTTYLENFLQKEERAMIKKHCAECDNCRHSLESLQKTKDILKGLDEIEPPPWLAETIMARIYAKEEKKSWFQRFFLPLRVKVPIQALAMIFVAVLSVYIYKSTAPDMERLDRPQHLPQVSEPGKTVEKTQTSQEKDIGPGPKYKEKKASAPVEKGPEGPAQEIGESPVPGRQDGVPAIEPGNAGMAPVPSEEGMAFDHTQKKGSAIPAAMPPSPAKVERYKVREPEVREEVKSSGYPMAATGVSQEVPGRITAASTDPEDAARKARRIMMSLSAEEIRERTENTSVIISCSIDPQFIPELKNKIAEVALVDESRTRIVTGLDTPQVIEIVIVKRPDSP